MLIWMHSRPADPTIIGWHRRTGRSGSNRQRIASLPRHWAVEAGHRSRPVADRDRRRRVLARRRCCPDRVGVAAGSTEARECAGLLSARWRTDADNRPILPCFLDRGTPVPAALLPPVGEGLGLEPNAAPHVSASGV